MKQFIVLLAILLAPQFASAQITVNDIPGTRYCSLDNNLEITIHQDGSWETDLHQGDNFDLQLLRLSDGWTEQQYIFLKDHEKKVNGAFVGELEDDIKTEMETVGIDVVSDTVLMFISDDGDSDVLLAVEKVY